ncbi:MAG TPA: hypothetical protein VMR16_02095, partial [Candidatus Saccharimonadales bacterium]|nr:hypothetical protein [Candidatus Saccharimonadales bacterium]
LVSTVYLLNQRGQQARKEETIATSSNSQTSKSKTTSNKTNKAAVNTPNKPAGQSKTQTQTPKLPATGVELSIVELVGIYSLAASVVAFVLSRRPLAHSL